MDFAIQRVKNALAMSLGQASDLGMVRSSNEDALLALDLSVTLGLASRPTALLAVADGMGGCDDGEIASALALKALGDHVSGSLGSSQLGKDASGAGHDGAVRMLTDAVMRANVEVFNQNRARGNGMGTTLVVALILGAKAYIANVGDSRAYLLRGGELRQVTKDHSLVADMVSAGTIRPERIYTHPQRNIITRSLGAEPSLKADIFAEDLKSGDFVLLCSDGLWEMVRDRQIAEVLLTAPDPQRACNELVGLANSNGGADNISVILASL
jgi:protein phosphatase